MLRSAHHAKKKNEWMPYNFKLSLQKIAIAQLAHLRKAEVLLSNPGSKTGHSNFIVVFLNRAL